MSVKLWATCAVAALFSAQAAAQTIGIGTTKGGATAQLTAAIAKEVSQHTKLQMRTQPFGGTQQYIPVVNAGELEFAASNVSQYWMAKEGISLSKRPYDNLRLASTLMVFQVGALVANNSDIKSTKDLRGKRIAYGFKAAPLFDVVTRSFLANGGLTYDDVVKVPAVAMRQHWDMLAQGKVDLAVTAIGTGAIKEMNAKIDGGVRFATLEPSEEAQKALTAIWPKVFLGKRMPDPKLPAIREPVYVVNYDYLLWTHKDVPDEVVYQVVKAVYENEKALKESSPIWRSFTKERMAKDHGTAYHPGAIKFYREVGLMKSGS